MPVSLFLQLVLVVEGELLRVSIQVSRVLRNDEPDGADEVRQDEDEKDESEHSEDVHEVDLVHDLVVVLGHGLQLIILLDPPIDASAVEALEQTLELLGVQEEEHFVKTEQAQQIEQVKLVLRPRVLEDLDKPDSRDGQDVDEEVAFQIPFGDALEISNASLATFLVVLVLHEEVADDVNSEAHLHDDVNDFGESCLGRTKAGIEGS